VTAKDKATNKEQKITITASTGLSKEEAEKMRREAEAHASEDKKHLEEIEARNRADNLVYQTEKLIRENREKLAESDVHAAEQAIEETKKAIAEGGTERINAAVESLTRASHRLAEAMYKATGATGGAGPEGGTGGPGAPGEKKEDVIDAEYVDVDESKRPN
jgi:molecular chaperone DnaK